MTIKATNHWALRNIVTPALNIIAMGIIVLLPHAELFPFFSYSIPILFLTWVVLKFSKETFSDIGFRFSQFQPKAIVTGGIIAAATLAFMQLVFLPVVDFFVPLGYNDTGLKDTIQSSQMMFLIMVIMGWLVGGFYEEIVFHGFIFTRLEKMIKGPYATQISFGITAAIFGVYHIQLGALGLVNALVVGVVYMMLFLYFKRNLWYSISCHGVYNTMVMALIYFDYL